MNIGLLRSPTSEVRISEGLLYLDFLHVPGDDETAHGSVRKAAGELRVSTQLPPGVAGGL